MDYFLYTFDKKWKLASVGEDELFRLLSAGQLGRDALVYVPETEGFLPAVEYTLLLARAKDVTIPPEAIAAAAAARRSGGAPGAAAGASGNAPAANPAARTSSGGGLGWSSARNAAAGTAAPAASASTTATASVAAATNPAPGAAAAAAPPLTPPLSPQQAAQVAASRPITEQFRETDAFVAEYIRKLGPIMRRRLYALLLSPLLIGIPFFIKAGRDRQAIIRRIEQLGLDRQTWQRILSEDDTYRRNALALRVTGFTFLALAIIGATGSLVWLVTSGTGGGFVPAHPAKVAAPVPPAEGKK